MSMPTDESHCVGLQAELYIGLAVFVGYILVDTQVFPTGTYRRPQAMPLAPL